MENQNESLPDFGCCLNSTLNHEPVDVVTAVDINFTLNQQSNLPPLDKWKMVD
jgi:hypothetical protein